MEADVDQDQLDIQVKGPVSRRREALGVIRDRLDTVHKQNREAAPTALVPLPDQPERDEEYDFLLTLEDEEGPDYRHRPTGAKRSYLVSELLNGVREEARQSRQALREDGARYEIKADTVNISDVSGHTIGDVSLTGVQNNAKTSKIGWLDKLTSWRFFSLAAAAIAVVLANILYQADDPETRFLIAGSAAIFVGVYLFLASFNPDLIFRRLMAWMIGLGLLANTGGSAFEAFFVSEAATGAVRWVGTASLGFYVACTVIVVVLAALEGWRMHKAA